jgi:hypothetical protein
MVFGGHTPKRILGGYNVIVLYPGGSIGDSGDISGDPKKIIILFL